MKITLFIIALFGIVSLNAQNIGINSTGANPLASAMLDIDATDKGLLIPRVNIVDLATPAPVVSPATSLLVYNTNTTTGAGYYYWDASKWNRLHDQTFNSKDHDWYETGGTTSPNAITDNIFTQGKVGIAVPSPVAVLDIVGDVAINRSEISAGYRAWMVDGLRVGAGGSDNAYFGLKNEGSNNADAVIAWGDDLGDHLRFINTRSGGPLDGVEFMRIEDEGNVGIGTINPSAKLEIADVFNGDISVLKLRNTEGSGTIQTGVAIDFHHFNSSTPNSKILSQQNGVSGYHANLLFFTEEGNSSSTGLQERMRISHNGKIGIGEPSPTTLLDVKGDVRIQTINAGANSDRFLVADATGVVKSAPIVTNVTGGGSNLRMYTGHTPVDGTGWVVYTAQGIYIDINISACGFTSPPQIFTTMGGDDNHWTTTGSCSTYSVTATGFRVYINYLNSSEANVNATPAVADANNWYIKWFAIGN